MVNFAPDSNYRMQRISKQSKRQTSPKKLKARIEKIVDLVKSPGFEFNWPEFMPPAASLYVDKRIAESTRQLPPNLRRHLRELARNWGDVWDGKQLNSAFEDYRAVSDPLFTGLPPQITMFETGEPLRLICDRYQEIRRWREILLKIARRQFDFYTGERVIGLNESNGAPIVERDELTRALNQLEDWRKIRECAECGSIYLETRTPKEPACPPPAKCRQRIRHGRSPRKPRPPSRLEEFRVELMRYCKREQVRRIQINADTVATLSQYTDFRPTTVKKCLEWIEEERREKAGQKQRVNAEMALHP